MSKPLCIITQMSGHKNLHASILEDIIDYYVEEQRERKRYGYEISDLGPPLLKSQFWLQLAKAIFVNQYCLPATTKSEKLQNSSVLLLCLSQICPRGPCAATSWWRATAATREAVPSTTLGSTGLPCPQTSTATTLHSTDTSPPCHRQSTTTLFYLDSLSDWRAKIRPPFQCLCPAETRTSTDCCLLPLLLRGFSISLNMATWKCYISCLLYST